ncbi:hypothetical protein TrLO_g7192 [Triparma laevis f. longispina]|uniref:Uncharacterized protein n=2 Tax=Triparma laevis TaxID=1534972 RepID=A0A9W7AQJ4_9STRA|nr:hypothetical protein TrLO_g7192 [Triparma laevis f. longispina]
MKFSVALFALTLTSVSSFLAPIPSRAFLASKLYSEEGEDASAVPVEETADEPEAVAVAEPEPEPERKPSKFENEIGAQAPLGFFDPLNLLEDADQERFDRLRTVELKHGRVSMLAITGHITTTAGVRLPGDIDLHGTSFASIGTGIKHITDVPALGWAQIFLMAGLMEFFVMTEREDSGMKSEFIGDFRNSVDFGWDTFTEDEKTQKRAIELNNGRAAQMGILGLMVHEMLPSHDPYMINGLLGFPVNFN